MAPQQDENEVSVVKLLMQAISKATWPDKNLFDLTRRTMVSLDSDLEEADYEPSSVTEEAADDLNELLNPSERDEPSQDDTDEDEDENDLRDLDDEDS